MRCGSASAAGTVFALAVTVLTVQATRTFADVTVTVGVAKLSDVTPSVKMTDSMSLRMEAELQSMQNLWKGGYFNNIDHDTRDLYRLVDDVLAVQITRSSHVFEIGCGRGAWTGHMLLASKVYCVDALSAENNGFWTYIGHHDHVDYRQIDASFSVDHVPDDSLDIVFSFDVFCHISLSAAKLYLERLFPKLKSGGLGFIMVADADKYETFVAPNNSYRVLGHSSHEEYVADFDGEPYPGRWYWYGTARFSDALRDAGYEVIEDDIGITKRDPVVSFRKP